MPEYLAPAVYIEEIASANKPIEGASTSTAAMVGMAARGPVNTPTLVTSTGSYTRLFGGLLDNRVFLNGLDALPHAALGFFANGGSRLYVTRIVGRNATHASADLFGRAPGAATGVTLASAASAGDSSLALSDGAGVAANTRLLILDADRSEVVTTTGAPAQTLAVLAAPLAATVTDNTPVTEQTVTEGAVVANPQEMLAGGQLAFADPSNLPAGTVLRLRSTAPGVEATEYVTIATADTYDIDQPGLIYNHPAASTEVRVVTLANGAATQSAAEALGGATALPVDNAAAFAPGDLVSIGAGASRQLRVVAATPQVAPLAGPLEAPHTAGVGVTRVAPLLRVHARYPGAWGNALAVRATPASLLATTLRSPANAGALSLVLASTFGLFAGSTIAIGGAGSAELAVIEAINRNTNEVTLAAGLTNGAAAGTPVASIEFNLTVDRIENERVVESESFTGLAMHAGHSRYALQSVGLYDRATDTAGVTGASELIRLSDLTLTDQGADVADAAAIRTGFPAAGATWRMEGGDDDLGSVDDTSFIGTPSDDPEDRTGIQALENEASISIVAVPGRTSVAVQNALFDHCEKMRYRFGVIEPPAGSKIGQAVAHRQNFDRKNGAIYYPWLVVPDPFAPVGATMRIPPSGHVMGIFARTDVTRGVWKAPANEVVNGILRLDTALSKGEQDILNPVHVNCFRDFRTVNRGLRLWGARTLSSDPEWRYVNVRRLLLFIEQSLDTGLQWAVFEPNAEPLWASVRQSISNFLIGVWRSGGLEGIKEEEAFFVQVGYDTTMTQTDIDNGRLIVVVGVAPVKPAEFVIVRISQKTREAVA